MSTLEASQTATVHDSLAQLIAALEAARTLGLKDVTVTTVPLDGGGVLPPSFRYYLDTHGHTPREALDVAGQLAHVADARQVLTDAREHQPRERAVPCSRCRRPTWAISAVCDACMDVDLDRDEARADAEDAHTAETNR